MVFGEGEGLRAGGFQKFAVAQRIGDVKTHFTGLASAEELSWTAQLEIGFGDLESVGGSNHGFESCASVVGHSKGSDENAMGFLSATADAPAQLMQLGKTKPFSVFDDHDGRVGNVMVIEHAERLDRKSN